MKLSIVTTLYKSAPQLEFFFERIQKAASSITPDFEVIMVNDGSPDESGKIAERLFSKSNHLKVIELSRNFGHYKAMMAGLKLAKGDFVFLIDCDLEEEPELLAVFWKKIFENPDNIDVVYGVQESRKGGWLEKFSGLIFYRLFNHLSDEPIPRNLSTCRLMNRTYVNALVQFEEREMFMAGLWTIAGYKQVPIVFEKKALTPSTYSFGKKLDILVNAITSFSIKPLKFIFYMGLVITVMSAMYIVRILIKKYWYGIDIEGWASIIASIWFLGGITIFSLGIIGIYLAKIYLETKKRPFIFIRSILSHDNQ